MLVASVVMGLVIGSFLTVVVDRVPRGASILAPPSACGSCGQSPHRAGSRSRRRATLVSARAGAGIAARGSAPEPLVIELANTALFVLFGLKFGAEAVLLAYWCLAAALVALVWIDLHEFRLPREITYTAFVISVMIMMNAAVIDSTSSTTFETRSIGAGDRAGDHGRDLLRQPRRDG